MRPSHRPLSAGPPPLSPAPKPPKTPRARARSNDVPTPNCSPAGSPEVDFIFFDVNAALPSSVPAAAPLAAAAGPAAPADGLHARVVARASALAAKFKSGR